MIKNIVQCLKCKRNRYKVIYKTTITFSLALDFTQHNSVLLTLYMYIFTVPCRTSWPLHFWRVCWGSSTHSWISCHGRTLEWTLSSTSAEWHGQRLFLSHACSGCFCRCCNSSSSRPEQQGQSQWLLLPSHICPLSTTEVNKLLDNAFWYMNYMQVISLIGLELILLVSVVLSQWESMTFPEWVISTPRH